MKLLFLEPNGGQQCLHRIQWDFMDIAVRAYVMATKDKIAQANNLINPMLSRRQRFNSSTK